MTLILSKKDDDDDDDDDFKPKSEEQSNRAKYMGATPQKNSATGRIVIERMRRAGKIDRTGTRFMASNGKWYPLKDGDMSHIKPAVTWWNKVGYVYGPRAREVRIFMCDPDNYIIDYKRINRAEGHKLGRYREPKFRSKGKARPSRATLRRKLARKV